uniref:Uncharacterized protein n=1 Tax=Poecilia mexicana TaxID=48701 RepID=A0A3B3WKW4_9TELE
MESTRDFFSKLRKLAVTLEAETEKLQQAFEGRRNEDGDSGERGSNKLCCSLLVQLQAELAEQKQREEEVSNFIKACRVMERRVSKDIHTIRTHLEKYGYQAPSDAETPNSKSGETPDETGLATEEDEGQEEDERTNSTPPPTAVDPFADLLRTPKLSDFGLSELQMKRALGGAEWCAEVPPMPELNLPQPSLRTPAPPPLAMTPKCALRMDDDDLQTPQMRDFGISEDTMCLNNDFTMALFRKKDLKPDKDPESPCRHGNPSTTPEVPVFETPYVSRLVSCKKGDRDRNVFELQTSPCNGASDSKPAWEYNVPEVNFFGVEEKEIPEMPNLESFLGNSLQTNGRMLRAGEHEKVGEDTGVNRLDLDGPTQEFSFGTPRIRMSYQEPSTPEMPDLSSVTQDICKVGVALFSAKIDNAPPAKGLSLVSQSEFQTLPSYLRLMTLGSLNQAVQNINRFTQNKESFSMPFSLSPSAGETKEFTMDDLRRIISVGTKAPVYVLCLTELQRLKQVDGVLEAAVYKLITGN